METGTIKKLVDSAIKAADFAYAPYSHYHVGASLLCADGSIYTGCNIENISYGATNCAERTAVFKAVSEGKREFKAIAIFGSYEGKEAKDYAYPCGICRQVLAEFAGEDFEVYVVKSPDDYKRYSVNELLPAGFAALSV